MNQPMTTSSDVARDIPDDLNAVPERRINEWAERRPVRPALSGGSITAVVALGVVLLGIIGVAFRGSWTAHRDAALASHFDATGAALYPFAPDGLIVIALIAAMVLRHDKWTRIYALAVVGLFTLTSFVVNHLHGLGTFAPDPASGHLPALPWPVVGLIAGQLIGAIGLGSHLIVCALRYLFPGTHADQYEDEPETAPKTAILDAPGQPSMAPPPVNEPVVIHADPDPHEVAKLVYGVALDLGVKVGRDKLAKACQISTRQAGRIRSDVETDREEATTREAELRAAEETAKQTAGQIARREPDTEPPAPTMGDSVRAEPTDEELTAGMTPLEVFSGPPLSVLRQQWRDRQNAVQPSPNGSGPHPAP